MVNRHSRCQTKATKCFKIITGNYKHHLLCIYTDFEAITEKVQSCKSNHDKSYTEAYQNHSDCSCAYKVVCCYDDKFNEPVQSYRGENAVNTFMEKMLDEVWYCRNAYDKKAIQQTVKNDR